MLQSIEAENFRSIRKASITFAPSGLTTIVGANGSGKSNIIKLIQFVGLLPTDGLEGAIRISGGFDALVPKALTPRLARQTPITIAYDAIAPSPLAPNEYISARHSFSIQNPQYFRPILRREILELRSMWRGPESRTSSFSDLTVTLKRVEDGRIEIIGDDDPSDEYVKWLGLEILIEALKGRTNPQVRLFDVIAQLVTQGTNVEQPTAGRRPSREAFLSPRSMALMFLPARALAQSLGSIKRYDLQLAELRKQQETSQSYELSGDGRGMPSAVQRLITDSASQDRWRRVSFVLGEIAPHVKGTSVSQLRSGQEFIQFLESKGGRAVESWQSSDGTLRALAILVALETAPLRGTVLIEEPEMGLHPWAIRTLISHFREVIKSRGIQIILSTHSQQVLDEIDPDEVRVAIRDSQLGTQFSSVKELVPNHVLERGEVGRMWVSGLLSGVPVPYVED